MRKSKNFLCIRKIWGKFIPECFEIFFKSIMVLNIVLFFILIPLQLSFDVDFIGNDFKTPVAISLFFFLIEILWNVCKIASRPNSKQNIDCTNQLVKDLLSLLYITLIFFEVQPNFLLNISSLFYIFRYQNFTTSIKIIEGHLCLNHLHSIIFSFGILISKVLLCSHGYACMWHYIGFINCSNDNTWLGNAQILSEDWNVRYIESLYFISATINKIGVTEILPANRREKSFLMFVFYSSGGLLLYVLVNVLALMQNFIETKKEENQMKMKFDDFFKKKKFDYQLKIH